MVAGVTKLGRIGASRQFFLVIESMRRATGAGSPAARRLFAFHKRTASAGRGRITF
jgi:hypothetical protein